MRDFVDSIHFTYQQQICFHLPALSFIPQLVLSKKRKPSACCLVFSARTERLIAKRTNDQFPKLVSTSAPDEVTARQAGSLTNRSLSCGITRRSHEAFFLVGRLDMFRVFLLLWGQLEHFIWDLSSKVKPSYG